MGYPTAIRHPFGGLSDSYPTAIRQSFAVGYPTAVRQLCFAVGYPRQGFFKVDAATGSIRKVDAATASICKVDAAMAYATTGSTKTLE